MGTLIKRRRPALVDQVPMLGKNGWKPLAVSWSHTSCSQWLCVHTTCQGARGVIAPGPADSTAVPAPAPRISTPATAKASPPSVRVLRFAGPNRSRTIPPSTRLRGVVRRHRRPAIHGCDSVASLQPGRPSVRTSTPSRQRRGRSAGGRWRVKAKRADAAEARTSSEERTTGQIPSTIESYAQRLRRQSGPSGLSDREIPEGRKMTPLRDRQLVQVVQYPGRRHLRSRPGSRDDEGLSPVAPGGEGYEVARAPQGAQGGVDGHGDELRAHAAGCRYHHVTQHAAAAGLELHPPPPLLVEGRELRQELVELDLPQRGRHQVLRHGRRPGVSEQPAEDEALAASVAAREVVAWIGLGVAERHRLPYRGRKELAFGNR